MIWRKASGVGTRPLICTTVSVDEDRSSPAGSSWFSLRIAFITWSTPMPSASSCAGRMRISTSRLVPPTRLIAPTPRTVSSRLRTIWSAMVVSSRWLRLAPGALDTDR
ncbi:hypothetical protein D3C81_1466750 [compost metagenome]